MKILIQRDSASSILCSMQWNLQAMTRTRRQIICLVRDISSLGFSWTHGSVKTVNSNSKGLNLRIYMLIEQGGKSDLCIINK